MEAATEKIVFGRLVKYLKKYDPESPILNRIIIPYFTDGSLYSYKQAGRRIIFFFYLPLLLVLLTILYSVWLMIKAFLCRRKTIANRHGIAPTATKKA